MQGAATQAMWFISEERQRRRCPRAAAPRRAAGFQYSNFLCSLLNLIRASEAGGAKANRPGQPERSPGCSRTKDQALKGRPVFLSPPLRGSLLRVSYLRACARGYWLCASSGLKKPLRDRNQSFLCPAPVPRTKTSTWDLIWKGAAQSFGGDLRRMKWRGKESFLAVSRATLNHSRSPAML